MTNEEITRINAVLLDGNKIGAIKLYRDTSGSSLADAKNAVERMEGELRAVYPQKFGLPATPAEQILRERIHKQSHLAEAIKTLSDPWTIYSFGAISMGWCAELRSHARRVLLTSHRLDVSAEIFDNGTGQWIQFPYHLFPFLRAERSDFEAVRFYLENAGKEGIDGEVRA